MNLVSGELVAIGVNEAGPVGTVDVRGARIRVPLLLTPGARVGDHLLIDAGVAIAIRRPDLSEQSSDQG